MNNRVKTRFALILCLILSIFFGISCTDEQRTDKNSNLSAVQDNLSSEAAAAGEIKSSAEEYKTGSFKIMLPAGWKAFAVKDSDGSVNQNALLVYKGVKTETDIFDYPGLKINLYPAPDQIMISLSPEQYEEAEIIVPIELENFIWTGFQAKSLGLPLALLYANAEDSGSDQFQIAVWQEINRRKINLEDEDLLQIISSIEVLD